MATWQQLLKMRGVDLENIRFSGRVEEDGCAVRALSSATGVRATRHDYQERFAQLDRQAATELEVLAKTTGRKLFERDAHRVRGLPNKLTKRDTPLGRALGEMHIQAKRLTPAQILREITSGNQVIGIFHFLTGGEVSSHAAHLRVDGASLRFVSDKDQPTLAMPPDKRIKTLVLKKR